MEMEDYLYREMYELEATHWWFRARRRIVLSLVHRYLAGTDGPRFLDLGCGTGAMLGELECLGEAVGTDASPDALSYASGHTGARLVEGRVPEDLGKFEGRFDCVLMLDLLEHLDADLESVKAASRLLAPGGILVVTVPAYQWLYAPRDEKHHHRRRYSRGQLRLLLDATGLKVELLSYYNTFLFPPAAAVRLLSRYRSQGAGGDLSVPPAPLNRALEALFASERFILPYMSLPFGLSVISVARAGAAEFACEVAPTTA